MLVLLLRCIHILRDETLFSKTQIEVRRVGLVRSKWPSNDLHISEHEYHDDQNNKEVLDVLKDLEKS